MSHHDIKHLKQLEFPTCAKEALQKLESLLLSSKNHSKQNLQASLVSEFIFLDRPKDVDLRKNGPPLASPLSSLQEFQLIIVLVEYFSQPGPDADRYAVFLLLFGSNSTTQRAKILCKLISTAISSSIPSVLSFASTWMSQVGCSTACLGVAQNLISDFITYSRKTSEQLQQLPLIAPHFTANFIISITELYLNEQRGVLLAPPDTVVEVFTDWINEHHNLCLPIQMPPFTLPNSTPFNPSIGPFPGLVRWVVLAPLVTMRLVYSKLHLALLQTMLNLGGGSEPVASLLTAQHFLPAVNALQTYASTLALKNVDCTADAQGQKSLERLAQILQIALHTKFVNGNMPQLLLALETLPSHPLMCLVIENYKKFVEINT